MISKYCIALGEEGEKIIAFGLRKRGYTTLNVAKIEEGGAPLFRSKTKNIIAPDIFAAFKGKSMFIEAKAKTKASYWNGKYGDPTGRGLGKQGGFYHGFETRHVDNYRDVQKVYNVNVLILLYEKETGDVFSISVDDVDKYGYPGRMLKQNGEDEGAMINIAKDRFKFEWKVKEDRQDQAAEQLRNDPRTFSKKLDFPFDDDEKIPF